MNHRRQFRLSRRFTLGMYTLGLAGFLVYLLAALIGLSGLHPVPGINAEGLKKGDSVTIGRDLYKVIHAERCGFGWCDEKVYVRTATKTVELGVTLRRSTLILCSAGTLFGLILSLLGLGKVEKA